MNLIKINDNLNLMIMAYQHFVATIKLHSATIKFEKDHKILTHYNDNYLSKKAFFK